MSKPMSEQMQKLAARYEKATGKRFCGKTNAQKIRAMSDEKLAVFLSKDLKQPCDYCQLAVFEGACTETLCEDAMMKWLQMPAEDADHSICGVTNLPCIRCNPGGCNNRKEGSD